MGCSECDSIMFMIFMFDTYFISLEVEDEYG